ncbi:MAG: trigger factor [Tissierellales bacterium]|nr:trigger factor [Tissierellales bacterium]MBN2827446.1 trigger factor [Tissierellales bacterium]
MAKIVGKEKNIVSIEFEISSDKFEESIQKAYLKMRGKINIPGFRKGKVPRKIIEMNYGKGVFYEEALDIALPELYEKVLDELELDPINKPKIDVKDFKEGQDIVIAADVEVMPDVLLPKLDEVEAQKTEYAVTDEDVMAELSRIQTQNARLITVENRPVEKGDTVVIDYAGFDGENQFEGGTAENHSLEIGSGSFIPGFEEGLVGHNVGEEVDVNVVFPVEYHSEELAGKAVVFKVKIHEIKAKELPELDDEFAKDVSEFDTLDELKEDTKKMLEKKAKDSEMIERQNSAVSAYVEASQVEVPDVLIEKEIDYQIKTFEQQMSMQGIDMKDYYKMIGANMDGLRESIKPQALTSAKTELVIDKFIKEKEFEITDEEIETELENLAKSYKIVDEGKLNEFKENLKKQSLQYITDNVSRRKAIEFITDNVKFVEKNEEIAPEEKGQEDK